MMLNLLRAVSLLLDLHRGNPDEMTSRKAHALARLAAAYEEIVRAGGAAGWTEAEILRRCLQDLGRERDALELLLLQAVVAALPTCSACDSAPATSVDEALHFYACDEHRDRGSVDLPWATPLRALAAAEAK